MAKEPLEAQQTELSIFSKIRNSHSLAEVMGFLEEENIAAIIEAIRSEKWGSQLFPLYFSHPNSLIRYEVASCDYINKSTLESLVNDKELIVRQAARKNLMKRQVNELMKTSSPKEINEPIKTNAPKVIAEPVEKIAKKKEQNRVKPKKKKEKKK
jgi:hypothetical protein